MITLRTIDKIIFSGKSRFHTLIFVFIAICSLGQGVWAPIPNFIDERFSAISFAINENLYVGLGSSQSVLKNDLWAYSTISNTWTQMADFPGSPRLRASSTSFNQKGYVICGKEEGVPYLNDFWEYSPIENAWYQKTSLLNLPQGSADGTAFSTSMGIFYLSNLKKLSWYNASADMWMSLPDYPGIAHERFCSFVIQNRPFVGLGSYNLNFSSELYEFDFQNNSWISKAEFPGLPRTNAATFSIDTLGFVGLGFGETLTYLNDFFAYNVITNQWSPISSFPGANRSQGVSVAINHKGYVGLGVGSAAFQKDFWEFSYPTTSDKPFIEKSDIKIYPNPSSGICNIFSSHTEPNIEKILIFSSQGMLIKTYNFNNEPVEQFDIADLSNGIYWITIEYDGNKRFLGKILLSK